MNDQNEQLDQSQNNQYEKLDQTIGNFEEKLDQILSRIKKIENRVNPPFYHIVIKWIFQHFLIVFFLILITFVVWKIWGIVDNLVEVIDQTKVQIDNLAKLTIENLEKLKFWK